VGAVGRFLVKENKCFVPLPYDVVARYQDPKEQFVRLMRHIYECFEQGVQNQIGPDGELGFDWSWPITIKVDIDRDGKHVKFVAEVSAEGEWQAEERQKRWAL